MLFFNRNINKLVDEKLIGGQYMYIMYMYNAPLPNLASKNQNVHHIICLSQQSCSLILNFWFNAILQGSIRKLTSVWFGD